MQLKESPRNTKSGMNEILLLRFEFIELLLRMGIKKYPAESQLIENLEKFLEKDIIANLGSAEYDYEGYRYEKIQTQIVNDLLQDWIEPIRKKFDDIKQVSTDTVSLQSIVSLLKGMKVQLIEADIIKCFAFSKMLVVDEVNEDFASKIYL